MPRERRDRGAIRAPSLESCNYKRERSQGSWKYTDRASQLALSNPLLFAISSIMFKTRAPTLRASLSFTALMLGSQGEVGLDHD